MNETCVYVKILLDGTVLLGDVVTSKGLKEDTTQRNMEYVDDITTVNITFKFTFPNSVPVQSAVTEAIYYAEQYYKIALKSNDDANIVLASVRKCFIKGKLY